MIVIPTSRTVNSTAEYTCDGGYKLDKGNAKRTCQDDGSWSGDTPECSKWCTFISLGVGGGVLHLTSDVCGYVCVILITGDLPDGPYSLKFFEG